MNTLLTVGTMVASLGLAALTGLDTARQWVAPMPIEGWAERKTPVMPGQVIRLEWHLTKHVDCPGYASRVWQGENGFYLTETQRATALPSSESEVTYRIPTLIPNLAPSGYLGLSIIGHFDCPEGKRYYTIGPVELHVKDEL